MSIPTFNIRQLVEAGVHFGHTTHRWNPKMSPFLFGSRNGIHIINLDKTAPMLRRALKELYDIASQGGHILIVGTKKQAREAVANAATISQQYYINHRWLGGTLTNWDTISKSIKHLKHLRDILDHSDEAGLTKKELLNRQREFDKLNRVLVGIKDMPSRPDAIFIIDTNIDHIAVKEARKLGIPVIAIVDSNSSIDNIDFPIPGNDDSSRAIDLYCNLFSSAVLKGLNSLLSSKDVDIGAMEDAHEEELSENIQAEVASHSSQVEQVETVTTDNTVAENTKTEENNQAEVASHSSQVETVTADNTVAENTKTEENNQAEVASHSSQVETVTADNTVTENTKAGIEPNGMSEYSEVVKDGKKVIDEMLGKAKENKL